MNPSQSCSMFEPQRSPLPTGAETHVLAEDAARLEASTKSAPHRSGDPDRGLPVDAAVAASTKSAPHRSGDQEEAMPGAAPAGLNEVRSPQERRPARVVSRSSRQSSPQRSPLPTGAETLQSVTSGIRLTTASTKSAPHRSGDVLGVAQRAGAGDASTKSAPHRSRDRRTRSHASRRGW